MINTTKLIPGVVILFLLGSWTQSSATYEVPTSYVNPDTFRLDSEDENEWVVRAEDRGDRYNLYLKINGRNYGFQGCMAVQEYQELRESGKLGVYMNSRFIKRQYELASHTAVEPKSHRRRRKRNRLR